MAARKVFGRVEFIHDDKFYIVELTKRGLSVREKRKHVGAMVGIRSIIKLLDKQPEFFLFTQPKPPVSQGERAVRELAELHGHLSLLTGCATDGNNWRTMIEVLTNKIKDTHDEGKIPTDSGDPGPGEER